MFPQIFGITLSSMPPIFSTFFLINEFLTIPLQLISTTVPHLTQIFVFLDHFVTHLSPPPLSINYNYARIHAFFLDTKIITAGISSTTLPPRKLPFPCMSCLMNILFRSKISIHLLTILFSLTSHLIPYTFFSYHTNNNHPKYQPLSNYNTIYVFPSSPSVYLFPKA